MKMDEIDLDKFDLTIFSAPFVIGWVLLGVVLLVVSILSGEFPLPVFKIYWGNFERPVVCIVGGAFLTTLFYYVREMWRALHQKGEEIE